MAGFSFQQLETLLAVAEAKNFSAAARRLGKPQSTVSTHIGRLERHVGRPLFQRSNGVMIVTEDGEALARTARQLLALRDQALARFGLGRPQTVIRLGLPDTILTTPILQALWELSLRWGEKARIETLVAPSRQLKSMLATGALDVAIAIQLQPAEGEYLWSERLAWVGAPHVSYLDQSCFSLVNYPPECPYRELVDNTLLNCPLPHSNAYVGGSLNSIVNCLSRGLGIGALDSVYAVQNHLEIVEIPWLPSLPSVDFCLLVTRSAGINESRFGEVVGRVRSVSLAFRKARASRPRDRCGSSKS